MRSSESGKQGNVSNSFGFPCSSQRTSTQRSFPRGQDGSHLCKTLAMCSVVPNTGTISPVHRPLLLCAFRRKYWKCFLLSVFLYVCLAASLTCWIQSSKVKGGCSRSHSFIPLTLFMLLYIMYLIECWRNSPFLTPLVSRSHVQQYVHLVRYSAPVIWWRVVCYHFVRRSRQIIRYQSGVPSSTTQVYYERTNSHVDEQEFDYSNCGVRDVSNELVNLEKHSLVVIDFNKCFSFSNLACENQYLGQRCDFFRANEAWDSYLEAKEGMKLRNVDWKDQVIVCRDPAHPPLYATHFFYWVLSALLCSWFYRVFLDHKVAIVNYQVEKLFGDANMAHAGDLTRAPLNRVATMDSTELEWQIQTNQLHVPSYGEATRHHDEQTQQHQLTANNAVGDENRDSLPERWKYTTTESSRDFIPARPMQRTRSWVRDGRRRSLVTSLRRSVSQLFGRPVIESDDDDVTLLSHNPRRVTSQNGRSLSEAPPTYSEAMELHRIVGFYDVTGRYGDAEFDVRNGRNLQEVTGGASSAKKFYRRKRPNQLRIRSHISPDIPSSASRYSIVSRDVTTGPAAVSTSRQSNPMSQQYPIVQVHENGRMDERQSEATEGDLEQTSRTNGPSLSKHTETDEGKSKTSE